MKRTVLPVISFIMVFVLLMASFGTAKAGAGDDPVVTPVSGDMEFTTEVVPIVSLPGVTELAGGMLAPVGFPAGEAQFGGNGVLVTGMDYGKATACFSLSSTAIAEGWGGKVALWNGANWVRLATSITVEDETNTAIACATITSSGTYAFIKYVTEPDKLPANPVIKTPCAAPIGGLFGRNPWGPLFGAFLAYPNSLITYEIINYTAPFFGDLSGSTTSDSSGNYNFGDNSWSSTTITPSPAFTIHIETPGCYFDWQFSEGFFDPD